MSLLAGAISEFASAHGTIDYRVTEDINFDPADLVRTLFDQSEDGLFLVDGSSLRILRANLRAELWAGRPLAELVGAPVSAWFHPERRIDSPHLDDAIRRCVAEKRSESLQGYCLSADPPIPVRMALAPVSASPGPLVLLSAHDLRDRRAREESESRLRDFSETANELFWAVDGEGRWLHVNATALRSMVGYEPEEVLGHRFTDFIAPEQVEKDWNAHKEGVQGSSHFGYETVMMHKNGSRVYLSANGRPIYDPDGRLICMTGTSTDITRWKNAEAALIESQHRFEAFMNAVPMVGFMKDADGRMVYLNPEFGKKFGRPVEYFLGKSDSEMWPAEIAQTLREADLQIMRGTRPVELVEHVPTPDGVLREWWVVKFPFRDLQGRVFLGGIAVDLTERQQLEAALRRSEERYRQLWQRNLAGGFRATLAGEILDCNDSFARLFGYHCREEMLHRSTTELYFDLAVREKFLARVHQQKLLTNYEMRMRRADGAPVWVLENVSLLEEPEGEVLEGTVIDITDRKRAEEALRASESKYRTLINHLDQGIFLKDRELRYVTVNPIFCEGVGKTEEELIGKTLLDVFPNQPLTEKSRLIENAVLNEERSIESEERVIVRGQPNAIRIRRTPVKDAAGTVVGLLGICWDVTEQRELEAQLRLVQKMEAIGQLAGGIAHDFNNLLTIMLGNLSFVLSGSLEFPAALDLLRNVEKAGLRAAELTQTLLGFSHRGTVAAVPCSLNEAIDEVVRLTRSTLPTTIDVEIRAEPRLGLVQADPTQLNQVLTNLTLNARDAMPRGGKIVYQTSRFHPNEDYLSTHVEARAGDFVRLRVQDTGAGIPPEIRQRIFEPFFTTKEKGKGTGLGLATVFSIVKQHRGWIVCDSEIGRGTTFDIFLPRVEAAAAPTETPPPSSTEAKVTILVVDDEAMIRQLTKTILTRAGYEVLVAENGVVALELFRAQPDRIALVILDAVMPRLSGRETLSELARIYPSVKVLFSSGFSTEQLTLHEFPQVRGFLPKPYRTEQLVQKVVEILGQTHLAKR